MADRDAPHAARVARYGVSFPILGVPLPVSWELFIELSAAGRTGFWPAAADGTDRIIPLAFALRQYYGDSGSIVVSMSARPCR